MTCPIPERQVATATVAVVPEVTVVTKGLDQTVSRCLGSQHRHEHLGKDRHGYPGILCIPLLCIDVKHQLILYCP